MNVERIVMIVVLYLDIVLVCCGLICGKMVMVVCDLQVVCLLFCRRLLDLAADAAKLNDVIVPPNHLAIE